MRGSIRYVYGFEYEEQADEFVTEALAAGYDAHRDVREDTIEGASVLGAPEDEDALNHLAMRNAGHDLGARPA